MSRIALIFFICLGLCLPSANNVYASKTNEPDVAALGAILMDYDTGRVLWERNSDQPMAMASTTKIMTAIYTLENANLEDEVTVSARAAGAPELKMFLKTSEKISLKGLMYALMLQSSNDAAIAIAEHVGGSVENFCKGMTERAKELGALDTVFVTPNGLDAGDHHSTAYDMAVITRHALSNPKFIELINTPDVTVTSSRTTYSIYNRNRLLNEYEGANGVKTGFTGRAGHCFVGAAKRGNMQLISVVLASGWGNKGKAQKWVDTKHILDYGFKNFIYTNIISEDVEAKEVAVERSRTENVKLLYNDGLMLPLTQAEVSSLKIELEAPRTVKAPIESGQKLGVAYVYVGGKIVKEIELVADTNVERHDLKTSFEKILNAWLGMATNEEVDVKLPEF